MYVMYMMYVDQTCNVKVKWGVLGSNVCNMSYICRGSQKYIKYVVYMWCYYNFEYNIVYGMFFIAVIFLM